MTAAQVAAVGPDGRLCELACGEAGGGVDNSTLFRAYCALKPITAIAIAQLVEQGRLDLDRPLGEMLPEFESLKRADIALRHVLNHTAGLHELRGFESELIEVSKRDAVVRRLAPPADWRVGVDAGYGEVAGWHLLGTLIEATTGGDLRAHLRSSVLDPIGMHDTYIGMTDDDYDAVRDRIGLNYDLRSQRAFPMLIERTRRTCTDVNCAYGGYTTAHDLAVFYSRLLARLNGGADDALPSRQLLRNFCTDARPHSYDVVLERKCGFGLGFMVDLGVHYFGTTCSRDSFGHGGWLGAAFGFADPRDDIAVGVILNGVIDRGSGRLRQPALVNAIYTDVLTSRHAASSTPTNYGSPNA
jgi:CubicO group peptidase (beta-lactamase class C family)